MILQQMISKISVILKIIEKPDVIDRIKFEIFPYVSTILRNTYESEMVYWSVVLYLFQLMCSPL